MRSRTLKTLGRRIRERRKKAGLSQEKLGEITGLHRNLIGLIERGETNPTTMNLQKVAKALGTTMSDLLDGL
jgi:XRE family transcriptional regulator, regulator of sulfur utilization